VVAMGCKAVARVFCWLLGCC